MQVPVRDLFFRTDADSKVGVDHDAAAVFADDYFFVHLDFDLALWGDAVEAAAAGVAVDGYYAESVARILRMRLNA